MWVSMSEAEREAAFMALATAALLAVTLTCSAAKPVTARR